jgi:cyclopropane fatty-acyl-phospholipid synthase-like methyltransferase
MIFNHRERKGRRDWIPGFAGMTNCVLFVFFAVAFLASSASLRLGLGQARRNKIRTLRPRRLCGEFSFLFWLLFLTLSHAACAQLRISEATEHGPFVPTPMVVVDRMLELAEVGKSDVVYDLGSGDGRIVIQAAKKYGARGVGIELDSDLVMRARRQARREGVAHLAEFRHGDALKTDLSAATVVTLYMLPAFNQRLRPILEQQLQRGARVVAHDYPIEGWTPVKSEETPHIDTRPDVPPHKHVLYLYEWRPPAPVHSPEEIPFVPSPIEVVDRMLELADVSSRDVVYDLGSGDGRIVIRAAKKYGARGVGIEMDELLLAKARKAAEAEGVSHLVEFRAEDALKTDLSPATVITLYMLPWFNEAMKPKFQKHLRPGARIVAHDFGIEGWEPDSVELLDKPERLMAGVKRPHKIFLWKIK